MFRGKTSICVLRPLMAANEAAPGRMAPLSGKVAAITGAADGIGRALAFEAAARGMALSLADRRSAELETTALALRARGADVLTRALDVTDSAAMEDWAEASFAHFGTVHLLVNNAGVGCVNSAWDTTLADYERVIGVNLFGVIHGVRAFVPRMLQKGEAGHLLNVASAAGLFTVPGLSAYCASKFAVVGYSEALFHDLRVRGTRIGVSLLCPSWVKTGLAMNEPATEEAPRDAASDLALKLVTQAVNEGIDATQVAHMALDAVEHDRFYVLTHDTTRAGFSVRSADLLADRSPRLLR